MHDSKASDENSGAAAVTVVAAVVRRNGKVLVCRRPKGKRHAGLWEFPGGKVRTDESVEQAVKRELAEELRLTVDSVGETLFSAQDPGSPFVILFMETTVSGEPEPLEHDEVRWVRPDALSGLPLAPADRRFAESCLFPDLP